MKYRFFNIFAFSPKIEWLQKEEPFCFQRDTNKLTEWLWSSMPAYSAMPAEYKPQTIVPEDLPEELRILEQQQGEALNNIWVNLMVETENPIREKIALFWHHQIPSGRGRSVDQGRILLEIFRQHGLGNLKELLNQVISTPATMHFLNLHLSSKEDPNENFPRELMELYLLGEGNYTLKDVKEVSRAFTGRRFDKKNWPYPYFFAADQHDAGIKTILGETGRFTGEDVIDIILKKPQTARHITGSFLRFFFSDNPPKNMIEDCADKYFRSGYEMKELVNAMIAHEEFNNPQYHLSKVKTPVELLTGFQRQTGLRTVGMKTPYTFLRMTGQSLFNPPTVAGWPGGDYWFEGERLLHRLFLPSTLLSFANRTVPKSSLSFKVMSRIKEPTRIQYRYIADARWNQPHFEDALKAHQLSVSEWILGNDKYACELSAILQKPEYQYI